jgi:biopolymer transport protein ExbB
MAGGVMMIFLIPTSVIALALIVYGLMDLRRQKVMPNEVGAAFSKTGNPPEMDTLRERIDMCPDSPLRRICLRLLPWIGMRGETWDMTVQQVTSEEVAGLYQRHSYLAVVYGVAPLMGLLGTIIGMIRTFYEFSISETRSVAELSQGINEALVTTMWGLMIAVPAYLFVSLFRQKLYGYENERIPARVRELFAPLSAAADAKPTPAGQRRAKAARE